MVGCILHINNTLLIDQVSDSKLLHIPLGQIPKKTCCYSSPLLCEDIKMFFNL